MHRTFYYTSPVELKIEIKMQHLDEDNCKDIFGGTHLELFNESGRFRAIKLHGRVATLWM